MYPGIEPRNESWLLRAVHAGLEKAVTLHLQSHLANREAFCCHRNSKNCRNRLAIISSLGFRVWGSGGRGGRGEGERGTFEGNSRCSGTGLRVWGGCWDAFRDVK